MSDQAIVFVADAKFLPHTKALAVNCRREGQFAGDFLWIVPDDMHAPDVYDLTSRGVAVLPVADRGFLMKFDLFHPYLKRWRQVLFLDADCLVQLPLAEVWQKLDDAEPYPDGRKPILADREEMPAFMAWQQWDPDHEAHGMRVEVQPDTSKKAIVTPGTIYATLAERYPHFLTDRMWNTSMVAWHPADITDDTVDQLRALQAEFYECNRPDKGGTDQQVIDLLLHQRTRLMPRKLFCYFGLDAKPDEHQNSRVASASRGWDGTEIPAVVHYARWYAIWQKKASNADGYFNDRIGDGVVTYDFYQNNLADWDAVFPRR